MRLLCFAAILSATVASFAHAQQAAQAPPPAPKTKIEAFTGTEGAVLIKGYAEIGSIKSARTVSVTAMTFRNAKSGEESKGVVIEVTEPGSRYNRGRSYIDYDELAGLLDGIDYVKRTEGSVTPYPFYEAQYSTRGDVEIVVFNDASGRRNASVRAGRISSETAFLKIEQLDMLRGLISRAKDVLENPGLVTQTTIPKSAPPAPAQTPVQTSPAQISPLRPAPTPLKPKPQLKRQQPTAAAPMPLR